MTEQNKPDGQQDFPGYPHYPASDDITNKGQDADDMGDDFVIGDEQQEAVTPPNVADAQDRESDVTDEDIKMLSAADQNRDMEDADPEESVLDTKDEDGDPLNEATSTYGDQGADLDVPGSEADDAAEAVGSEDEENNYYSLGGDNHESLEEDPSA